MSYIALYRQYRPQTFQEIKGQEPISKTLKNALASGRISHAYLFCGPRGTGKTSTAKVLAKAVNCRHSHGGEPCNECSSCQLVNSGNSMDVLEIDAASNRGIDEIRDLREKVNLSPVEGRYKVYIVDEVHMLTPEAFNALLKTLEEPPGHVIFILATTDPRKIPPTILSRCQRFDFRQIAIDVILARLREVAEAAEVTVEEEAFYLMARQAQGGLRDALGLLDQCLASGAKQVSLREVADLLGAVEDELLLEFYQIALAGDTGGCLLLLDRLLRDGKELKQFIGDLTLFYRNLLLISLGGKAREIVPVAPEIREQLIEAAKQLSQAQYATILRILNQTENDIRWSSQARILVELGIINLVEAMEVGATQAATKSVQQASSQKAIAKGELAQAREQTIATRSDGTGKLVRATSPSGSMKVTSSSSKGSTTGKEASAQAAVDLETIRKRWSNFLEVLRKKAHASYAAFLVEGDLRSLEGATLICEFSPEHHFHQEQMEKPETKKKVEQVLEDYFGTPLKLKCCLQQDPVTGQHNQGENEIIQNAIDMFGGQLVDIVDE